METNEIMKALNRLKVEIGSLVCLGCGHEHNCGVHGCAVLRETVGLLEKQERQIHIVLNPAFLPGGLKNEEYARICGAMMSIADCVAFLPDWEESRGAQVEYAWCKYVGKPMMGLRREEEA